VDANTPMALRMAALQQADDLSVDARGTERLLRRAHDGLQEDVDPELSITHNRTSLEGKTPSDGLDVKLEFEERGDKAVFEERASGTRGSIAQGSLQHASAYERMTFSDDATTTTRAEGHVGITGVAGAVSHDVANDDGTGHESRGSASFDGHLTSLQAEHMSKDPDVDGAARGVGGKLDIHRLGFTADLQARSRGADGSTGYTGGNVTHDPTGLSVSVTHGGETADGDALGHAAGAKLESDMVGVTIGRQTGHTVSATESEHTAKLVDGMLGDRKAAAAYMAGATTTTTDEHGVTHKTSRFARVAGRLEAFREVHDHGPVQSDDPRLEGRHRVEVHQKVDGGGSAFLGNLSDGLGLFGGLKLQKGKEIRYRTHLKPDQAEALARKDESVDLADRAKKKLVGHSLLTSEVELPNLKRPEKLKVHDEVEVHTSGSLDVALGVMAYGLRAGAQVRVAGDFRLRVKKTGNQRMEVEVMPTRVRGVQGRFGALPAEVGAGVLKASAFVQRFDLDLSTEAGRVAYNGLVGGVVPGSLSAKEVDATKDGLELVHSNDLAAGVTRTRVEKLDVKETNLTGRLGWMLLSSSRTRSDRTTDHMASDGSVSVNLHTRTIERKRNTLLTGNEHTGATGAIRTVSEYDWFGRKRSTFDALTLSAHYSDDKVKKDEVNRHIVDDLNAAFGLGLPHAKLPGDKGSRAVVAQVRLEPSDLRALRGAGPDRVDRAAAGDAALASKLKQLVDDVRAGEDDHAAARTIQQFIASQGTRGVGAVVALAGVDSKLQLSTRASTYDQPLADARKLASRHRGRPWDAAASKKELSARYTALRETQDRIDVALERLGDDPFLAHLPEERDRLQAELVERRAELEPLIDLGQLSHEDALTVYSKLDRGWTTSRQQAFMGELVEATGLKIDATTLGSARATSMRPDGEGGVVRTRSISDQRWLPVFGDERTQVSASTHITADANGVRSIGGMKLRAELLDEKSRGKEVNLTAVRRLNKSFGADIKGLGRGDSLQGARRELTVERALDADQLKALGSLSDSDVDKALSSAGSKRRMRGLVAALRGVSDAWEVSGAVERHVAAHGLEGMGDVHLLAGGDDLQVVASTDAYTRAAADAGEVAKRWSEPLRPGERNKDIAARFSAVREARGRVEEMLAVLNADRLTPTEDRYAEAKLLKASLARLEEVSSFSHLGHADASALSARLSSGWTSRGELDALSRLREDCGLVSVERTRGGVVAHARREIDDLGTIRETHSRDERASFLRSGAESVLVTASRVHTDGAALEIEIELHDTMETTGDLDKRVVQPLNRSFGTDVPRVPSMGGDGGERTVRVKLEIDDAGIERAASLDAKANTPLIERAGLKLRHVVALQQQLLAAGDATARGTVAGAFIAQHGLAGAGVLSQLAGANEKLSLSSRSGAVEEALQDAARVFRAFGDAPLHGDMNKHELLHCLRELDEAKTRIAKATRAVDADPLLNDEQRAQLGGALRKRAKQLEAARSLDNLDGKAREALADRLDQGWTSVQQRGLIQQLRAPPDDTTTAPAAS
jgi:hypothetical protein